MYSTTANYALRWCLHCLAERGRGRATLAQEWPMQRLPRAMHLEGEVTAVLRARACPSSRPRQTRANDQSERRASHAGSKERHKTANAASSTENRACTPTASSRGPLSTVHDARLWATDAAQPIKVRAAAHRALAAHLAASTMPARASAKAAQTAPICSFSAAPPARRCSTAASLETSSMRTRGGMLIRNTKLRVGTSTERVSRNASPAHVRLRPSFTRQRTGGA